MTKKHFKKLLMRRVDRNRAEEFTEYIARMKNYGELTQWDYSLVLQCLRWHLMNPKVPAFVMTLNMTKYN